MGTLS